MPSIIRLVIIGNILGSVPRDVGPPAVLGGVLRGQGEGAAGVGGRGEPGAPGVGAVTDPVPRPVPAPPPPGREAGSPSPCRHGGVHPKAWGVGILRGQLAHTSLLWRHFKPALENGECTVLGAVFSPLRTANATISLSFLILSPHRPPLCSGTIHCSGWKAPLPGGAHHPSGWPSPGSPPPTVSVR